MVAPPVSIVHQWIAFVLLFSCSGFDQNLISHHFVFFGCGGCVKDNISSSTAMPTTPPGKQVKRVEQPSNQKAL